MLVKYDAELGKVTGLITNFKEAFKFQPKKSVVDWFSNSRATSSITNGTEAISKLAGQFGVVEESAINFAQKVRDGDIVLAEGQTMLQGYTAWMRTTGQATQATAIKTALLTGALKLLSTIGWTIALTVAINLLGKLASAIEHVWHKTKYVLEAAEYNKLTKLSFELTKLFGDKK